MKSAWYELRKSVNCTHEVSSFLTTMYHVYDRPSKSETRRLALPSPNNIPVVKACQREECVGYQLLSARNLQLVHALMLYWATQCSGWQWMLRLNERHSSLKEHQLTCRSMKQTVSVYDCDETPTPTYQHFISTKQLFLERIIFKDYLSIWKVNVEYHNIWQRPILQRL